MPDKLVGREIMNLNHDFISFTAVIRILRLNQICADDIQAVVGKFVIQNLSHRPWLSFKHRGRNSNLILGYNILNDYA